MEGNSGRRDDRRSDTPQPGGRLVAAIELGTTSIRMAIAQLDRRGGYVVLDSLQQAVSLGKDTFTRGYVERATVESCAKVLNSFRRILAEYGIEDERSIQAVATSAVREAANRDALLDRIYVATGINVKVIDQAEVNRFTYLAVKPVLDRLPFWKTSDAIVIEVGGGSTEALMFRRGRVGNSHLYRFGSLRLSRMLDDDRAGDIHLPDIMRGHVDETAAQIVASISPVHSPVLLALGGEARFACAWLNPGWDRKSLVKLNVAPLDRLTRDLLRLTTDERVKRYEMTYPDAETVGPALLTYTRVAKALRLRSILVCEASLRNGMLWEMAAGGSWTEEFKRQIVNSAVEIGKKYDADPKHARHVAGLAVRIFRALRAEHRLDPKYEVILTVAALLHEVGLYVSRSSHHKHSMYLILNSDLFGLGSEDIVLAALVARYHRRALPSPVHEHYADLDRHGRIQVAKLAAILRVADALDSGLTQRLRNPQIVVESDRLILRVEQNDDIALERHRLREKGQFFEQVYGKQVVLEGSRE